MQAGPTCHAAAPQAVAMATPAVMEVGSAAGVQPLSSYPPATTIESEQNTNLLMCVRWYRVSLHCGLFPGLSVWLLGAHGIYRDRY